MPLKTKINKKIKKRNTKKRIFRRKKTKRKNSKKRKTRRMRGGSTIEPLELENVSLEATTDDDFFKLAKTIFKYTTDTMAWGKRKGSVIQMLKTLKNKVEELAKAKEDLTEKEGELATARGDLETLNTMASVEGIITKPSGQFSTKFNTIVDKLVNLSEKEGQLKQVQEDLTAKGAELAAAKEDLVEKEGQLAELQRKKEEVDRELAELQSALTEKETELEKVKEEHTRALDKMKNDHQIALEAKRTEISKNARDAAEDLLNGRLWNGTCKQNNNGTMDAKNCFINGYVQGVPTV